MAVALRGLTDINVRYLNEPSVPVRRAARRAMPELSGVVANDPGQPFDVVGDALP